MIISQRLEAAGITLELSVCISAEALRLPLAGSLDAEELSRISIGSSTSDQMAVLDPVQRMLVQGHEALRESLAQLALAYLEKRVTDARGEIGK